MSEEICPGQSWVQGSGRGAVRVWLVDADRIGVRRQDGTIRFLSRARFLATYKRARTA